MRDHQSNQNIIVVIPVYNESSCIEKVALEWKSALQFQKVDFEILFVNDGSTDNTKEILEKVCAENREFSLINQENGGHGNALMTGYHAALAKDPEYIFQVDSDDQFLPSDFSKLWKMRESAPFILGIRSKRNDPLHRIVISRFLKYSLFVFFGTWVYDANIPYRLIQTSFLRSLLHCIPTGVFAPNVFLSILASKYVGSLPQCPVTHVERKTGTVSIVRWGLIKACLRTFSELIKFSRVLDFKVSRMQIELREVENHELKRIRA